MAQHLPNPLSLGTSCCSGLGQPSAVSSVSIVRRHGGFVSISIDHGVPAIAGVLLHMDPHCQLFTPSEKMTFQCVK